MVSSGCCAWLQVLQREKDVADLEAMHRALTAQLEQRLAHVETRLAKETDRCRQLEHRCVQHCTADWHCGIMGISHLMIFVRSSHLPW